MTVEITCALLTVLQLVPESGILYAPDKGTKTGKGLRKSDETNG